MSGSPPNRAGCNHNTIWVKWMRTFACLTNGATVALCGQANLARRVRWRSSESPIEESEEETEGLCLCERLKLSGSDRAAQILCSSTLYSTLVWTPSRAPLAASMEALFCGGSHTQEKAEVQPRSHRQRRTHTHTNARQIGRDTDTNRDSYTRLKCCYLLTWLAHKITFKPLREKILINTHGELLELYLLECF